MSVPRVLEHDDAPSFLAELVALGPGYVPEWLPEEDGIEGALAQIAARYLQAIARRAEQAPTKNELAFLDLLGVRLVPAQPARAPIALELAPDAAEVAMPAGTRIAAPPPPGGGSQITYETETPLRLTPAALSAAFSLWPGRDQYIDHSAALTARTSFRLFDSLDLQNTEHALYVAHERLLALAGPSAVTAVFELATGSSESLDVRWQYWDGGVWRPFRDTRPDCSNADPAKLDSTGGLQQSGAYRLEADCATTGKTTVAGVESFWIRGVLSETLPSDPARVLPDVESIRLSTEITRAYTQIWDVAVRAATAPGFGFSSSGATVPLRVRVRDATGVPLAQVEVSVAEASSSTATTDDSGFTTVNASPDEDNTVVVGIEGFEQQAVLRVPADTPTEVVFTLDMPALERAIADGAPVDLTKPFFPLGAQPQPGSAFYFSHSEAFSKPGARLRLYLQPSPTVDDTLTVQGDTDVAHVLSWEYWNGRAWSSLLTSGGDSSDPADLRARGTIELTVPDDIAPTSVNDQEALWMRVHLVSGSYGVMRQITVQNSSLTFFIPQPPVLADFRLGYTWQDGPYPPEHVFALNDFQHTDVTFEAQWPGKTFKPFVPVGDSTPGLYLGFTRRLPNDLLGIYFGVVEEPGDSVGPALVWEYWDGFNWERLPVQDETRNLRVAGVVSFIGPVDMQPFARFGTPLHWLRARLSEDGPPGSPTLALVAPNAVWVVQRQTVTNEPIGATTGQANEVLTFRQVPVLPGQQIEVRELAGPRANVEWRILASELLPDPAAAIQDLETALAAEGSETEVRRGPLRLRRDRLKQVTEVWVAWEERPTLFLSGPTDRHYALDRARGRLLFGDGENGRIPPVGAPVSALRYETGGGRGGNVGKGMINQLLGPIGGLEKVDNVAPAEGGADAETAEAVLVRGPATVRSRGRAVTVDDFETMAREASPSVAVARAIPNRDADGRPTPGCVTLVIIPSSAEPRPFPSFGLRQQVLRYLEQRAPADLAGGGQIVVAGPEYQPVDVSATLVVQAGSDPGAVERTVHDAVVAFLHPLTGGPAGRGWTPGEDVYLSDLAVVVEGVDGVDFCSELALLRDGISVGEQLDIGPGRMPVAGDIRVRLVEA